MPQKNLDITKRRCCQSLGPSFYLGSNVVVVCRHVSKRYFTVDYCNLQKTNWN